MRDVTNAPGLPPWCPTPGPDPPTPKVHSPAAWAPHLPPRPPAAARLGPSVPTAAGPAPARSRTDSGSGWATVQPPPWGWEPLRQGLMWGVPRSGWEAAPRTPAWGGVGKPTPGHSTHTPQRKNLSCPAGADQESLGPPAGRQTWCWAQSLYRRKPQRTSPEQSDPRARVAGEKPPPGSLVPPWSPGLGSHCDLEGEGRPPGQDIPEDPRGGRGGEGTEDPSRGGAGQFRGSAPDPPPIRKGEGSCLGALGMWLLAWGRRVTGPGTASCAAAHAPPPERAPGPARSAPGGPPAGASLRPGWAPAPAAGSPGHTPGGEEQTSAPYGHTPAGPVQPCPNLGTQQQELGAGRGRWLTCASRGWPWASGAEGSVSSVACVLTKPASCRQAAVYAARSARAPSSRELWGS